MSTSRRRCASEGSRTRWIIGAGNAVLCGAAVVQSVAVGPLSLVKRGVLTFIMTRSALTRVVRERRSDHLDACPRILSWHDDGEC